jgi:hypothetical protein
MLWRYLLLHLFQLGSRFHRRKSNTTFLNGAAWQVIKPAGESVQYR